MAANPARKPGSNLGRPAIDWEAAFAFYASLSPASRSYQAVAGEFGVSVRTVEKHGRSERWKQRLQAITAHAAAETNKSIGSARADHLVDLSKLIHASLVAYAEKLRRGDVRMSPGDLDRLHKLWQQLGTELAHPDTDASTTSTTAVAATRKPEHTAAVIAALGETGALTALGLQIDDVHDGAPKETA